MKKKILLLLFLCAISVAALQVGGRQILGDTAATGIAFLLHQNNADLADLDARDSQNHAVKTATASSELEELFRQNLVTLTVFAAPHAVTEEFSIINSISNLFNKQILSRLWSIFELFQDAIFPPEKRFVHNVDKLCITFSVGAFACSMLLCLLALSRSPRKVNLRC